MLTKEYFAVANYATHIIKRVKKCELKIAFHEIEEPDCVGKGDVRQVK